MRNRSQSRSEVLKSTEMTHPLGLVMGKQRGGR
jgi:hypothetical protein